MIHHPGDDLYDNGGAGASDDELLEQQPPACKSARKGSHTAEIHEAAAEAAKAAPMDIFTWPGARPDQQKLPAPCEPPPHVLATFQEDMAGIMATATASLKRIEDAMTAARATGSPAASVSRTHDSSPKAYCGAEPLPAADAEAAGWGPLSGSGSLRLYGPPHAAARAAEQPRSLCLRGGGGSSREASAAAAPKAAGAAPQRPAGSVPAAAASGMPVGGPGGAAAAAGRAAMAGTGPAETSAAVVVTTAAPASAADDAGQAVARQDGRDRKTKRNADEPDEAQSEEDTDPAPPAKKMAGPRFASV